MLGHHPHHIEAVQADRRAAADRRRSPCDPVEFERTLLAAASHGESAAAVIQRLTSRIRGVARAHRLAPHDTDDVVQSTWLRFVEHHHHLREPAALGAWLQTTARRESLRVLRDSARVQLVEEGVLDGCDPAPGIDARVEAQERRAVLGGAIESLPERQRRLMVALLADPEPSYSDIARDLDMPIGSIGPTRARCLERLRRDTRLERVAHGSELG